MSRAHCSECHYPLATCVCAAVERIDSGPTITIIQHPKEANNAKNTARLVTLCYPNCEIIVANETTEIDTLAQLVIQNPQGIALLYPGEHSEVLQQTWLQTHDIKHLIVIDATWRKAKRMIFELPWLMALPMLRFEEGLQGAYKIRKTSIEGGLSTLEACAYVLEHGYAIDAQALRTVFNKMQSFWPHR